MTPAARLSAAIEILDRWRASDIRAERLLRDWGRANRYAGSKDRRAISDIVYDCLRRMRSLGWPLGREDGRALVIGLARAEGWDLDALFSGDRFAPAPLTAEERAPRDDPPPPAVANDHPDWLTPHLRAALGDDYAAAMALMAGRAPVDLRVNRLKTDRTAAAARLAAEGIACEPAPLSPDALRCGTGAPVARAGAYLDGWVELQDVSSQAAVLLAAPRPGEAVLDYCAGGGGKTLALAALMGGAGRLVAHDVDAARMAPIAGRARRAGAAVELRDSKALAAEGAVFDLVFVDAPCSGSGVWRRDPEAKWRLTPDILDARIAAQRQAVEGAIRHLKPGGRLVYATCSLFGEENEAQAARLLAGHRDLTPETERRFSPLEGGDGFYAHVFRRAGNSTPRQRC